jgi:ligand-binding sensor domain-containing protein
MKSLWLNVLVLLISSIVIISCSAKEGELDGSGGPWQVYTVSNTKSGLVSDRINSIFVDISNKKWFATDGGVSGFSRAGWMSFKTEVQFVEPRFGRISHKVNAITDGMNSALWFGLEGGGIRRYVPAGVSQTWTSFSSPTISADVINDMSTDFYGDIWAVTFFGISRYTPNPNDPTTGQWRTYTTSNAPILPTNFITAVVANTLEFRMWFGAESGHLITFDDITGWQRYTLPNGASPVNALSIDKDSRVWVATGQGVHRFSANSGWVSYTVELTDSSLPSNVINDIINDANGNVWFGTEKGLAILTPNGWSKFTRANSPLPSDNITALAIDLRSNLWIGTNRGVAVYNENGIR